MTTKNETSITDKAMQYETVLECVNMLEKDEYGLYKNAENYQTVRDNIIAHEQFIDREKLNKIPKFIRRCFNAL
jgi:hypothetical protein